MIRFLLRRIFCRSRCWSVLLVTAGLALLYVASSSAQQVVQIANATPVSVVPAGNALNNQQPFQATGTSGGAASITLTIAAVPGKIVYVQGIVITGSGATAAGTVTATLKSGGTTVMSIDIPVVAIATNNQGAYTMFFSAPFPGLGPGQSMVLAVPSFGAGNTASSATMWGFTL